MYHIFKRITTKITNAYIQTTEKKATLIIKVTKYNFKKELLQSQDTRYNSLRDLCANKNKLNAEPSLIEINDLVRVYSFFNLRLIVASE